MDAMHGANLDRTRMPSAQQAQRILVHITLHESFDHVGTLMCFDFTRLARNSSMVKPFAFHVAVGPAL